MSFLKCLKANLAQTDRKDTNTVTDYIHSS